MATLTTEAIGVLFRSRRFLRSTYFERSLFFPILSSSAARLVSKICPRHSFPCAFTKHAFTKHTPKRRVRRLGHFSFLVAMDAACGCKSTIPNSYVSYEFTNDTALHMTSALTDLLDRPSRPAFRAETDCLVVNVPCRSTGRPLFSYGHHYLFLCCFAPVRKVTAGDTIPPRGTVERPGLLMP